jgi:hypothetical protein
MVQVKKNLREHRTPGEAAETTRKKDTRFSWPLHDSLSREDVMASIKTKTNHSSEDESTERTCLNK